jgi:hypothetical protein
MELAILHRVCGDCDVVKMGRDNVIMSHGKYANAMDVLASYCINVYSKRVDGKYWILYLIRQQESSKPFQLPI